MTDDPSHGRAGKERKTQIQGFSLYPRDIEILDELVEHFGSNKSDMVRTALRNLHSGLRSRTKKTESKPPAKSELDPKVLQQV